MLNKAITMNPDGPIEQIIRTAKHAEDEGFDTCYIADQGFTLDVFVTLTAIACNTDHLRLGPGVTHPFVRHPAATAVSIASLDHVSRGRAFLGVGAGGSRTLVPMSIQRQDPLVRVRELVEISRLLWTSEPVNFKGVYYALTNARVGFPCRESIEIHLAARGPKMLELGGEVADNNILHGIPKFELEPVAETIRKGARKSDRQPRLQYTALLVYDDVSREVARARTVYRLVDSADDVKAKLGLSDEKISEMRRLITTTGPKSASHLVSDEILDQYIIQGDTQECASNLRQLVSTLGLTGITIKVPDVNRSE